MLIVMLKIVLQNHKEFEDGKIFLEPIIIHNKSKSMIRSWQGMDRGYQYRIYLNASKEKRIGVLYTTCPVNGNHKKRYHMGFDFKWRIDIMTNREIYI